MTSLQGQLTTAQGQNTTLQGQVTSLQADKDTLSAGKKTAEDAAAASATAQKSAEDKAAAALAAQLAAEDKATKAAAANAQLQARSLTLTLAAKRFPARQAAAMVTGPVGGSATVSLKLGKKQATALGLSSTVLATVTKPIGTQGALLVTLTPGRAAAKALAKAKGSVPVTVDVASGGTTSSASATLTK